MSVKDFVQQRRDDFIALRRDFHMYPEPAWLEYRSAAKVAEKLIALGYDVALGAEVLDLDSRMGLPSEDVMKAIWHHIHCGFCHVYLWYFILSHVSTSRIGSPLGWHDLVRIIRYHHTWYSRIL